MCVRANLDRENGLILDGTRRANERGLPGRRTDLLAERASERERPIGLRGAATSVLAAAASAFCLRAPLSLRPAIGWPRARAAQSLCARPDDTRARAARSSARPPKSVQRSRPSACAPSGQRQPVCQSPGPASQLSSARQAGQSARVAAASADLAAGLTAPLLQLMGQLRTGRRAAVVWIAPRQLEGSLCADR